VCFEHAASSSKKTRISKSDGAQDGAKRTNSDPKLGRLVEQLESLSEEQREAILRIIGGAKSKRG
jgi:hypothetical protein